jgi:hypothetical protein
MHQHTHEASVTGSVVLELGGDTGALIIYTGRESHGREIDISPVEPAGAPRTHSAVRERRVRDGVFFSAVYPELPAGTYTVWADPVTPVGEVTVLGGVVVEFAWPSRPAAG